jgi:large subunit ribosomal protein L18
MPHGSRYRVPLRRRREQKTDYQARKAFIVSHRPRLVARSSLKNTVAQIVVAKPIGDFVLASAHSKELVKTYGWKAATGNIPAAYLTGLLCGLKAKKNGVTEAILDLGLVSPTKGSKVFSTLSGVVDAGVTIPHNPEKILKERIRGDHIVEYAESIGSAEEYAPKFSTSLAKGLSPTEFGEHFDKVKTDIFAAFGVTWKPEPKPVKVAKAQVKPEAKKAEAKPVKAEVKAKPEVEAKKPEEKPAEAVVAKKPEKPAAKPKAEVKKPAKAEVKVETKAEAEVKAEEPEAKPAAKSATKKAPAKPKAEKKTAAKEAGAKPAKKTGGKKA